jgi:uncharacterized ubiquitin-like protein YukD
VDSLRLQDQNRQHRAGQKADWTVDLQKVIFSVSWLRFPDQAPQHRLQQILRFTEKLRQNQRSDEKFPQENAWKLRLQRARIGTASASGKFGRDED